MFDRHQHWQEVNQFLQGHFGRNEWEVSIPHGTGTETYRVQSDNQRCFVKVGAPIERYERMAAIGLTPDILVSGQLESGPSIMVQPVIEARTPSRRDFREQLERVAAMIRTMHRDAALKQTLSQPSSNRHEAAGLRALHCLRQKWMVYREKAADTASFVDHSLDELDLQIRQFSTEELVVSHGDICNANWLFAWDGRIYIIDLESMSMDDPAFDMGALLWWYYPPELRESFLTIAGYAYDRDFQFRMQVRMALHSLNILLPREQSFDSFHPDRFKAGLEDFRAVLGGNENPQGYA